MYLDAYHCTDCGLDTYVTDDKRCEMCGSGRVIVLAAAPEPDAHPMTPDEIQKDREALFRRLGFMRSLYRSDHKIAVLIAEVMTALDTLTAENAALKERVKEVKDLIGHARLLVDTGFSSFGETVDYSPSITEKIIQMLDRTLASLEKRHE